MGFIHSFLVLTQMSQWQGQRMTYHRGSCISSIKNRQKKREPEFLWAQESREGGKFRGKRGNLWKESSTYCQDCGALWEWKDFVLLRIERNSTTCKFCFVSMQITMWGRTFLDTYMSSSSHGMEKITLVKNLLTRVVFSIKGLTHGNMWIKFIYATVYFLYALLLIRMFISHVCTFISKPLHRGIRAELSGHTLWICQFGIFTSRQDTSSPL